MQPSRQSVKTHSVFGSIGSSLSTEFNVYLFKCLDPYMGIECTF